MNDWSVGILRRIREEANLTEEDVVSDLKKRGISISVEALKEHENGVTNPHVNTFVALCDICKVSGITEGSGHAFPIKLAVCKNEWTFDLYNDFFNANLLGKIYILFRAGIPSFKEYEKRLSDCFPSSANAENFDRLYRIFSSLNENGQEKLLDYADDLVVSPKYVKSDSADPGRKKA